MRQRWLGNDVVRIELWVDDELKISHRTNGERLYREKAQILDMYGIYLKKRKWELYIIAIPNE